MSIEQLGNELKKYFGVIILGIGMSCANPAFSNTDANTGVSTSLSKVSSQNGKADNFESLKGIVSPEFIGFLKQSDGDKLSETMIVEYANKYGLESLFLNINNLFDELNFVVFDITVEDAQELAAVFIENGVSSQNLLQLIAHFANEVDEDNKAIYELCKDSLDKTAYFINAIEVIAEDDFDDVEDEEGYTAFLLEFGKERLAEAIKADGVFIEVSEKL